MAAGMEQVADFCRRWDMLPSGGLVLCAVSGGRDSMALLHLLKSLSEREGFSVAAAHFNHQLRPAAVRDEDFVRAWCAEREIPVYAGRADVRAWSLERGVSQEAGARALRYAFLERQADELGAARIATAHHRQDNAETVLLHLMRGTGLQGLTGIPPVRGRIVRPLLETDRGEIESYIEENSIPYVEDETNRDPGYTSRNRLRLEVLPILEELSPGCAGRIAGTARLLREDNACLEGQAQALLPPWDGGSAVSVPAALLRKQDAAVARRLVRAMARRLGEELSAAHVEAVLALSGGRGLDLPGRLRAVCRAQQLTLERKAAPPQALALRRGEQSWCGYTVRVTEGAQDGLLLAAERLTGRLTIAPWDGTGRLHVENGSRTVKRLFADRGIPVERRGEYPALYLDGKVIAVFGVAVDRELQPREGESTLAVALEKEEERT